MAGVVVVLACGAAPSGATDGRRDSVGDDTRQTVSEDSSSRRVEATEGEPVDPGPQSGGPLLKPGFPVDVHFSAGTWQCCSSGVLVADVDGDPDLEILVSGVARGLVTAVDADGTLLPGWPVGTGAHQFLSAAEIDPARPGLEIVSNDWGSLLAAYDVRGRALPGWPRRTGNEGLHPAVAADLDADGVDELLLDPADERYWAMDAQGDSARGTSWPRMTSRNEQRLTQPTVADLDGDGSPEVLGAEPVNMYRSVPNVYAWRADGTPVPGWPVRVEGIDHPHRIVVGDILGDSAPDIVVEVAGGFEVLSPTGQRLASWTTRTGDDPYAETSHPALGDLDGDGDFEVVVATPDSVHALQGDGTELPGWPRPVQHIGPIPFDNAHPMIGDLDNDGRQDVVLTADTYGSDWVEEQWVWAWDAEGGALPGFPFWLPSLNDWAPAIADIDGNGRSDLVLAGRDAGYRGGYSPGVFVFEYPAGEAAPPDWGQLSGGARRQGVPRQGSYADPATPAADGDPTPFTLLRDAGPGSAGSAPEDLVLLDDGHVVYTADTPAAGRELWISDGTTAGTRQLADIRPGTRSSAPDQLVARDGHVWFAADDGVQRT